MDHSSDRNSGGQVPQELAEETLATRLGPVPIYLLPKETAFAEWERRAAEFPVTGKWPLLLGAAEKIEELSAIGESEEEFEGAPEEILATALTLDPIQLFAERLANLEPIEEEDEDADDEFEPVDLEVDITALDASAIGPNQPSTVDGSDEEGSDSVLLSEIPCAEPWQVFSVRPFGGWNETPSDAEITAVLKAWNTRFGAVPIGITQDVLELWVPEPVTDPAIAAVLATEMYAFCCDIVDQGVGSVHDLAQAILNAHVWFFWWD